MFLDDEDARDLKVWVMRKLEDISDADPDVLADYVLALIRTDIPDTTLREDTSTQLQDFLQTHTQDFVDALFHTVRDRSYSSRPSKPSNGNQAPISTTSEAKLPEPPRTGTVSAVPTGPRHTATAGRVRKRTYQDVNGNQPGFGSAVSPSAGRGKRGKKEGNIPPMSFGGMSNPNLIPFDPMGQAQAVTALLAGIQGDGQRLPAVNPSNPAAAAVALQAMGLQLPPVARIGSPTHGLHGSRSKPPCTDYNTKGLCTRGASCPFDHGTSQILIPSMPEYDPHNPFGQINLAAMLGFAQPAPRKATSHGRRANFSMAGPNYNRALTTIVVEQIPEENFEEPQVRKFFEAFGAIEDVDMQAYKRLAIVRFVSYEGAKAAYDSPKVIFDNRFVKVYWYNPNAIAKSRNGAASGGHSPFKDSQMSDEPEFDRVKFEEKTAEAQRKHEERSKLREEAEVKTREIERQRLDVEKKTREARTQLAQKMRDKGMGDPSVSVQVNGKGEKRHHNTEALRAQLAALEEEARALGIDPDAMEDDRYDYNGYSHYGWRGRGRGGYRARGPYHGWSYSTPYRHHGWSGGRVFRGASSQPYRGAIQAGGRYNLDLRPKRIRILAADRTWDETKDEALREHLFSLGEFESVESVPPDEQGSVIVNFKDRATAESLFYGPREIASIGHVSFAWIANPKITISDASRADGDVEMSIVVNNEYGSAKLRQPDYRADARDNENYDVADEDERWIVT